MSTSTNPNKFDGDRRLLLDEMIILRDARLEKLVELLAQRRMTAAEVADVFGVSRATAHDYLHRLDAAGDARRTQERDASGRVLWTAGEPEACPSPAKVVPARQVGMWRDALVAPLFGPPAALLAHHHPHH